MGATFTGKLVKIIDVIKLSIDALILFMFKNTAAMFSIILVLSMPQCFFFIEHSTQQYIYLHCPPQKSKSPHKNRACHGRSGCNVMSCFCTRFTRHKTHYIRLQPRLLYGDSECFGTVQLWVFSDRIQL